MIKILMCNEDISLSKHMLKNVRIFFEQYRLKGELSVCKSCAGLRESGEKDPFGYDIYILDASDEQAIKWAGELRRKNYISSLIFLIQGKHLKLDLLKYRPTAVIFDIHSSGQIHSALKYACGEQVRWNSYFCMKNKDKLMRFSYNDILYFESNHRIVVMHTQKQIIEFYGKLSEVLEKLPSGLFVRCHQSYIINLNNVKELDKSDHHFMLLSGETIDISKKYYPEVLAVYENG